MNKELEAKRYEQMNNARFSYGKGGYAEDFDEGFKSGFDAAFDIWREETKALVEALEFECGNRCAAQNPCNAREAIEAFKAKGLL